MSLPQAKADILDAMNPDAQNVSLGTEIKTNQTNIETNETDIASNLQIASVDLTAAEIKALNTTPQELVAAPGAGKVIEFVSAVLFLDHGGIDYDTNGNITIQTDTTNTTLSDTIAEGDFLFNSADSYRVVQALSADEQLDANEALEITVGTGDPATGDGILTIKVMYRVHDFS